MDKIKEELPLKNEYHEAYNKKEVFPKESGYLNHDILNKVPKNKKTQKVFGSLNKLQKSNSSKSPPKETINQFLNLYNKGKLSALIDQAEVLIKQYPKSFMIWNIMGAVKQRLGQVEDASFAFKKVTSLNPTYAGGYNNLGIILQEQGKIKEAMEAYKKAIYIKPNYAEVYSNIGNILKEQSKLDEAIEIYKKALLLKPDYAEAYNYMGIALEEQGKLDEAIEAYNKAISFEPHYADAYLNLGLVLHDQGKLDEAIEVYNKALSFKPDYALAHNNIGLALKEKGNLNRALEAYKKAISYQPDFADAYLNLGLVFQDQGKLNEALDAYKKALSLKPNYALAYSSMGKTLQDQGNLNSAIEVYKTALSIKPNDADTHKNLSFSLLNSGRLKEGFEEYEWRFKISNSLIKNRNFSKPLWDGKKSLKGKKILLWSEQGIGDTINWCSLLSFVNSQVDHCILECPEKLVPLLTRSFPKVEIKSDCMVFDKESFDFHIPMGSLYKHFLFKFSQEYKPYNFLIPDPHRVKFWKERLKSLGNGPYVGISWKSSEMSPNRLPNYASISEWSPILTLSDITFINLQYQDFVDDLNNIKNKLGVMVHNFNDLDHFNNLDDVVALCAALDVIVSIKNIVPTISAGVGTLTKLANWRQSPWNNVLLNPLSPSVKIFERDTWEPWENIFRSISKEIIEIKNSSKHNG